MNFFVCLPQKLFLLTLEIALVFFLFISFCSIFVVVCFQYLCIFFFGLFVPIASALFGASRVSKTELCLLNVCVCCDWPASLVCACVRVVIVAIWAVAESSCRRLAWVAYGKCSKSQPNFIGSRYKLHTLTHTHICQAVCVSVCVGLLASIVYISTRSSFPLMMSSTYFYGFFFFYL